MGRNLFADSPVDTVDSGEGRNLFADAPQQVVPTLDQPVEQQIDIGQVQPVEQPQLGEPGGLVASLPEVGGEEALGTIATGIVAEPFAGLAGIAQAVNPFAEPGAGARAVETVREALTFIPDTPEGQAKLQQIAGILAPVGEAVEAAEEFTGDIGFEAAGPVGGAIGATVPTAALTALGAGGVRRAAQVGKVPIEPTLKAALERGTVLTTDVIPPKTFVGKAFQKVTERIPVIGTGGARAAQQKTRIQALDDIAREFDIDPSSTFEADIVKSANNVFKRSQNRASQLRTEAITELNKLGDIQPTNAVNAIDRQIDRITALGTRGDASLLESLQNIKGELSGNFERLKDIRTTIFQDIKDIGSAKSPIRSGGDASLSDIAGALSKDLDSFAVNAGKAEGASRELSQAANKWKASNRIFKDNFSKAKETELKKALTKGKVQPEIINTVIRGGKPSELNRLHGNLDLKGREAVKQQILKSSLEKANGNPTIFLNELNRLNNRKAVDVFFKGKDRKELDGLKKFLDITRRAQTEAASIASQAEVSTVGLVGGAALAPKPVIGASIAIGLLGRGFESAAVRNLLLKLGNAKSGSKRAKDLANQVAPLIASSIQETKQINKQQADK